VEVTEQNVSNDTSVCYEDYSPSLNKKIADAEEPVCKKRKIHAQEKDIQEDIVKEKSILVNNSNGYEKSQEKQNNTQIHDQQYYKNALALTTHIQPPNLSDSDSNDTFSTTIPANDKKR
jgi:hypothetical protein